jgi:1-pyrroline-4-hydroxy-2-carboxylate deaminase
VALAGGVGWVAGYAQVFPQACLRLFEACVAGDLETALPLYRTLHPLLRWDSRTEFVQAIKLGQDMVGRTGGACRPPRQPLDGQTLDVVRAATQTVLDAGLR